MEHLYPISLRCAKVEYCMIAKNIFSVCCGIVGGQKRNYNNKRRKKTIKVKNKEKRSKFQYGLLKFQAECHKPKSEYFETICKTRNNIYSEY